MALFGRGTPRSALTRARLWALLSAGGTALLSLATAHHIGDMAPLIGAVIALAGSAAAAAAALLGREDVVMYGSIPALIGSGVSGAYGLEVPDPSVALGMTGAVLSSLALYEFGTMAALIAAYISIEHPREEHDLRLVDEALDEQARQVLLQLGIAFLITMGVLTAAFVLAGAPASPAAAAVLGALALTGAAALLVLKGGKFGRAPYMVIGSAAPRGNTPTGAPGMAPFAVPAEAPVNAPGPASRPAAPPSIRGPGI